jgi:glucosyl-3-phosphoglycerate phosphatase
MRRLVLVRHGESVWNAEGRIQGQACNGLSDVGIEQANVTARTLAETYPDAILLSSDIYRTKQTVAPLSDLLGVTPVFDARLRERHFGAWETQLRTEIQTADADRWARHVAGEDVIGEIGGETAEELVVRVLAAFTEVLSGMAENQVVIAVTHGGPVYYGVHRALGLNPGVLGTVANTSITELVQFAGKPPAPRPLPVVLERYNEIAHLPVGLRTLWRPARLATNTTPD